MIVFEHVVPTAMIWLGLTAALAACAFSYRRFVDKDIATVIMAAVRLLFFLLLAWCLLLPGLKRVLTQKIRPRFVVALDTSDSMGLSPSESTPSRWSTAMQVLEQPWTDTVAAECDIDAYAFSAEVGDELALADTRGLQPEGKATLLREALKKVTGRYAGLNVAGGLLLSDGIDTREAFDDWAEESRPFPIYTVLLEPVTGWEVEPDVRIDAVNTPRRVTVDWNTELKAALSGHGTHGRPLNVQLFKNNVLHREQPTQIPTGGGAREVLFKLDHTEMGVFTYRVFVPPLAGESHTNDNDYAVSVQVVTARNHLLYVEGPPRWESKYLSRALRANEQITPLVFLRGPGGKFLTFGTRGSMTADMKEDQLAFFKIVILGNLDAAELGEQRARNLLEFTEAGGSLVLLGGSKAWGESGFLQTALKNLVPAKRHATAAIEGEFPVALTDAGRTHPSFAGDPNLWDVVPPVLSAFPGVVLSAGAQALVTAETPAGPQPVIVVQRYGQGKVVAVFTDSLWKWQLSPTAYENRPYRRFWDQLISWLSPKEEETEQRAVDLFADREQLFLGEEITISARTTRERSGDDVTMNCEITTPDRRTVPFSMRSQSVTTPSGKSFPGFVLEFSAERPGLYAAKAVATMAGKREESYPISFFVKPFTPESLPRPANAEILRTIAARSGGKYFESVEALDAELSSLQSSGSEETSAEYTSLWQHWLMITCLMALLSIGWSLRKSRNMP